MTVPKPRSPRTLDPRAAVPGVRESPEPPSPAARPALRERLLFLNDATVRIGASLDLDQTVRGFADAVVPGLADFAAVHLLDTLLTDDVDREAPDPACTRVRRMVAVHREGPGWDDPAPGSEVQVMPRDSPCGRAMATGEPVLVPATDPAVPWVLAGPCPAGGSAPPGRGSALLAVPLQARGQMLGCAVLLRGPDRPAFDEVDVLTAAQLAAQTGLGVANALLYRREAAIADALQRSMLPPRPPRLVGVEVAHRYLPGSRTAQVGGDWFDAIPLSGSRVALVVGDVMGHGIRSAATMGQLRTAVQTLAALDLPPDQVLRHLDDLAQRLDGNYLATCIYSVYDPVARRCAIANAGHVPPILVRQNGRAELLGLPTGAPIGVGGVAFEPVEVEARDGDLLVLCTDGLVEVRGQDIGSGLAALCENLAATDLPLEELCGSLLRALHTEDREDDVALLVARLRGIPSCNVAQWLLQPRATTPALVRRLIRRTLAGWNLSGCGELAELLATELVTNAIRYASRPIGLRLLRTDVLLCEVRDDDHRLPVLRNATDIDEHGRGLSLVSRLSRRWGASRTATGKVVWFELALPGGD